MFTSNMAMRGSNLYLVVIPINNWLSNVYFNLKIIMLQNNVVSFLQNKNLEHDAKYLMGL